MKNKKYNISNNQLHNLIAERLTLQSTQRNLSVFKIASKNLNARYFESAEFARTFSEWDEQKQKNFLETVSGRYSENFNNLITKNLESK